MTFSGAVSGIGALTKSGAGTLTLTGTNIYGGGTTISDGTLQVGNGGTSGSISGNVTNNGTLAFNRSDVVTFGGAVSGNGALSKSGAGMLTLSGYGTYLGTTSVNAGTLRAGAANTFSVASAFTLASGAILDLNSLDQSIGSLAGAGNVTLGSAALTAGGNNASTMFSGAITGAGGLTKTGTGNLTLSGSSNYSGPTIVNAGTLSVNGSIASSHVTVNSGGVLGGIGTVGATTVNSGGMLSPGNSIGLLTIDDNLVLGPGAIYRVEVSATDADRTNVTGTAQLGGTLQLVFQPGPYTTRSYTLLSAAGGRSGTFDSVTVENQPAALKADVTYTTTDVMLMTLTSQIMSVAGLTPNQRAVAAVQDAAFNGGLPMINALFGLTAAQLPRGLDQLSGEVHASTASVLADESLHVRSAILGRLRQASDLGTMDAMAALRLGGPQAFAGGDELSALAYATSPVVAKAPPRASGPGADVVFWAQGFGTWGRFNGDGNAAGVRRDLAGFVTGVDTRVGASGRAGLAAGYTSSRNTLDGRGASTVESAHLAVYGGWSFGAWTLRAGSAYAFHTIDTERTINFPGFFDRATARYDGGTGQVFGEIGHGFALGALAVEPFAGGAWVQVKTDAAAERATVAGLNVAGTTFETGYATLGVRAASLLPLDNGMVLLPRGSLAWQHAFNDVTPNETLAFQTTPAMPFAVTGVPIARDALLVEAGLDLALNRQATIGITYTGQIASHVADHAAKAKFSWAF